MRMTKEKRVKSLIEYLKKENDGYASLQEPAGYTEKRRLLRSLMNVRWPGWASDAFIRNQDALLKEELLEKGVVTVEEIPAVSEEYPCTGIKNGDRMSVWQGDITRLAADGIVNAANSQMLGCFVPCHGCIDNAIHSAAGIQLRNECADIMDAQGYDEPTGKAKITKGYNLPAKHVLHTVGPIVGLSVTEKQKEQLRSCYLSCMILAEREGLKTLAFCCISTGEFHFPNKLAAQIAVETVDRYLSTSKLTRVIFNVFKDEDLNLYRKMMQ